MVDHHVAGREVFVGAMVLLFFLAGCGGPPRASNATVPVSGTVTQNGQAVEGASVTFERVDGTRGAVGRTDSSGRYSLTTFQAGDGAEPGEYRVTVVKYEVPEHEEGETPPLVSLIPEQYASVETSGLTATVQEQGENIFDFELE